MLVAESKLIPPVFAASLMSSMTRLLVRLCVLAMDRTGYARSWSLCVYRVRKVWRGMVSTSTSALLGVR